MHRPTLGIVAILFALVGAALWTFPISLESGPGLGGMMLRIGMILGLFWLAWPDLARISIWLLGAVVVGCAVLAAGGWYYILIALMAAGAAWFLIRRAE